MHRNMTVRWGLLALCAALLIGCSTPQKATGVKSTSTLTRKTAVAELGKNGDMSCYDDLVVILRRDPERLIRSQAAFALGDLGLRYYSVGFHPLVDSLENDPSAFVRAASALALSYTRDSRAIAPLVTALRDMGRGEVALRNGDKVVVYRACVSDAARTSLESILQMSFASKAETAQAKREDTAAQWENWYQPRRHLLPGATALASK